MTDIILVHFTSLIVKVIKEHDWTLYLGLTVVLYNHSKSSESIAFWHRGTKHISSQIKVDFPLCKIGEVWYLLCFLRTAIY